VSPTANDPEAWLGRKHWLGSPLAELLGSEAAVSTLRLADKGDRGVISRVALPASSEIVDVTVHVSGGCVIVELEPASPLAAPFGLLPQLESAAASFERAPDLQQLCERAAVEFRRLTSFDRVMVYRFVDDDAGVVVAEQAEPGQHSFLNHHFPASDIPKQARRFTCAISFALFPTCRISRRRSFLPGPTRSLST
jgi:light-regulated signal transduction histidine kinase (bacteriophytochrome)